MEDVLAALLATEDPPTNYALTPNDVRLMAIYYDWECRVDNNNCGDGTYYDTIAQMVSAKPAEFLADISRYYGDKYYLDMLRTAKKEGRG